MENEKYEALKNGLKVYDKHVAFWGSAFSNFYPCEFKLERGFKDYFEVSSLINNTTFDIPDFIWKSSEQCFMAYKALMFEDIENLFKIINSETPEQAKKIGRKIKNFDDEIWSMSRKVWMERAVYAKFSQNEDLKEFILSPEFEGKDFVEGSPFDGVWGVKMDYRNPDIDNPENWNGENLLGKVLNEVRKELKEEELNEE